MLEQVSRRCFGLLLRSFLMQKPSQRYMCWNPNLYPNYTKSLIQVNCQTSSEVHALALETEGVFALIKDPGMILKIMKLIYHGESSLFRQITRKLSDPQNSSSYISIHPPKAMLAETSAAESVSCSDASTSLTGKMCSASAHVNSFYEEARTSDVNGYYSCDDKFTIPNKPTNRRGQERESHYQMLELDLNLKGTIDSIKPENLAERILSFLLKLAAVFRYIPFELSRRKNTITPSSPREDESRSALTPTPTETTMKDRIGPCLERIQKLEKKYEEIRNKPVEIPVEKERMLMDSLERIKSVEFDLEKTKRALHATVMKQMEITEMLESIRESQLHRRRLFC